MSHCVFNVSESAQKISNTKLVLDVPLERSLGQTKSLLSNKFILIVDSCMIGYFKWILTWVFPSKLIAFYDLIFCFSIVFSLV